jgi:hypothetical protein
LPSFDDVVGHFRRQVALPWLADAPPAGRVWIAWYDKALERKVRGRLHELEHATRTAGRRWRQLDLVPLVPAWLAGHELLMPLLEQPDELRSLLPALEDHVVAAVKVVLAATGDDEILAVTGCGALFGLVRTSSLIARVASAIGPRSRMLLTFPGRLSGRVYHLLDGHPGWDYHAVPIPPAELA